MTLKILGVGSSMRKESHSTAALKIALDHAKNIGAEIHLLDLREVQLPMLYSKTETNEIQQATNDVEWADAFILATPDYHGSMSGTMKNFLDFFWSEFAGKLFGYICASHEKGLTVMDHMRTSVRQCYGWSMPYGVSVSSEDFDENGNIQNKRLSLRLQMLSRDLFTYGKSIREQFLSDLKNDDANTFTARYRK